jgi:hypothetical protein
MVEPIDWLILDSSNIIGPGPCRLPKLKISVTKISVTKVTSFNIFSFYLSFHYENFRDTVPTGTRFR